MAWSTSQGNQEDRRLEAAGQVSSVRLGIFLRCDFADLQDFEEDGGRWIKVHLSLV